jgi:rhomboid protease GluP
MYTNPGEPGVAMRSRDREACLEARLVLDAAGIESELLYLDGWWLLLVDTSDLPRSEEELEAYQLENQGRPRRRRVRVPVLSSGRIGLLAYAAVLLAVAVLANQWAFGLDWFESGAMQAARVMDGEWWRTVTALTLHGDAGHLAANLVFGTVFGLLAAQALGSGVAWAGILCAGALGNALNALIQQPGHTSIGASTAVFAALAVVVAHSMRYWGLLAGGPLRQWSPLVGGVLLLAYTGTGGERTDVAAHLTGFLAGLTIGWVGSLAPPERLRRTWIQATAAVLSVGVLVTAWVRALSA